MGALDPVSLSVSVLAATTDDLMGPRVGFARQLLHRKQARSPLKPWSNTSA